jgi:hypothetical protein
MDAVETEIIEEQQLDVPEKSEELPPAPQNPGGETPGEEGFPYPYPPYGYPMEYYPNYYDPRNPVRPPLRKHLVILMRLTRRSFPL